MSPDLRESVKELRNRLALNQAELAQRLGHTTPTIEQYENTAPPHGESLAGLAKLAIDHEYGDLAAIFVSALLDETPSEVAEAIRRHVLEAPKTRLSAEEEELLSFWRTDYPAGTVGYWARKMVLEALELKKGRRPERIG